MRKENSEDLKHFPYTFSLVALDDAHMAAMLKEGAAQYTSQALLSTQDSGKSWNILNIPNATLYSLLRAEGRYWAVGTEVIHKDHPGGGLSVPVALSSSDGQKWNHSAGDLSACKREMSTVCETRGCFSSNGVISGIFSEKSDFSVFPANKALTTKWASTDSTVCFMGNHVECATLKKMPQAPNSAGFPVSTVVASSPLGAPPPSGPRCIVCGFDAIFIDRNAHGAYKIKLALGINKNGT